MLYQEVMHIVCYQGHKTLEPERQIQFLQGLFLQDCFSAQGLHMFLISFAFQNSSSFLLEACNTPAYLNSCFCCVSCNVYIFSLFCFSYQLPFCFMVLNLAGS